MDLEYEKNKLAHTDREFSWYAKKNGTGKAFEHYAADSAIIYRDFSNPVQGKQNIASLFTLSANNSLEWEPFFADISNSRDFGYTLGKYTATTKGIDGVQKTTRGFYVTIWKRQSNGSWKYVFDSGVKGPKND